MISGKIGCIRMLGYTNHVEARGKEEGEEQEPHAPRDARALAHHHHAVEGVFQRDGAALEVVCDLVVEFHGLVDLEPMRTPRFLSAATCGSSGPISSSFWLSSKCKFACCASRRRWPRPRRASSFVRADCGQPRRIRPRPAC